MILRQFFDKESSTYTYLIADEETKKACLIDPVRSNTLHYMQIIKELDLSLTLALDTHVHADHITALGVLRDITRCRTIVGSSGDVSCADEFLSDEFILEVGNLSLKTIFTPGHTDNSFCFYLEDRSGLKRKSYVFTGDTLLIRGTGRTDFQNGCALQLFNSLHEKLMNLPPETIVYPGHDYKGWTSSTIAEEKKFNPRLLIKDVNDFANFMANLNHSDPKMMDIAVPANLQCGKEKI